MPVKILLADKSITIQKVVEMLFSGKDYEVLCVSDGETALSEASRISPDVVLADIDLPRVDGYAFSARLRELSALAKTPVILMMSRDDVYDEAKGRQAMITDHIAKPFESQELIGKVRKAVAGAPQRPAESAAEASAAPKPQPMPEAPKTQPVAPLKPAAPAAVPPASAAKSGKEAPVDIFDIIEEAPSHAEMKQAKPSTEDEGVYEVEPVVEFEEELDEGASMLPRGAKAVEEMREGLGLADKKRPAEDEIVSFESIDMGGPVREYKPVKSESAGREWKPPLEPAPAAQEQEWKPREESVPAGLSPSLSESDLWNMAETVVAKVAKELFAAAPPVPAPGLPEQELRSMVEKTIAAMAKDVVAQMPPPQPPPVSPDVLRGLVEESVAKVVRDIARDVIEKVAWEVIPDLAELLIKAEIERLASEP